MFKQLQKLKHRNAVMLLLLAAFVIGPMIVIGVGQNSTGNAAGEAFGREIPMDAYQREYRAVSQILTQQLGGSVPEQLEPFVRQQAWDRVLLVDEARRRIAVSDDEVARFVRGRPEFQQDGRFLPDLYFRFVRGSGMTPQAFEDSVRDQLRVQKLIDGLQNEATVTDEEVERRYAEEFTRLDARLAVVRPAEFEAAAADTLDEAALQAAYSRNQHAVQRPARRRIEYVGAVLSDVMPSSDEVADPAQREADGQKRLLELSLDLRDDLDRGLRFEEIALTRNLTVGTYGPAAQQELASLPGKPTVTMLNAAFDTALGEMTEVKEEPGSVFLLRAVEEIPAYLPTLDEVRDEIRRMALREKARELARARAQELRDQVAAKRDEGWRIEEAFLAAGVTMLEPAPFAKQDPIEGFQNPAGVGEALAALEPGAVSQVIDTPDGFVFGVVAGRAPYDAARFERERETFRAQVLTENQQARVNQWFEGLKARAKLKSFLEEPAAP